MGNNQREDNRRTAGRPSQNIRNHSTGRPAPSPSQSQLRKEREHRLRMQEKRKKIKRRLRIAITFLVTALILAGLYFGFQIQEMKVSGNTYCDAKDVKSWVQEDRLSGNSLYLWVKYKYMNYKKLPGIDRMEAQLTDPWHVTLRIYEKELIGCVKDSGGYAYFDMDGTVLVIQNQKIDGVMEISGLESGTAKRYETLPVQDKSVFKKLLSMTQAIRKNELSPSTVSVKSSDITLQIGDVKVLLGSSNLSDKIAQLPPILKQLKKKKGTLDLSMYEGTESTINFQPESKKKSE